MNLRDGLILKRPTKPNDGVPGWIHALQTGEPLPGVYWDPPPKWTIKYSQQSPEHLEFLKGRGINVRKDT